MARSRFRLNRVRRVRAIEEELARVSWQGAERAASAEEERVRELTRARADVTAQLRSSVGARELRPAEILVAQRSLDRLDERLRDFAERARTLRFQADQARSAWETRRAEVRGLDRLEERSERERRRVEGRAEAALLDEVAIGRAFRPSRWAAASKVERQ